MSLPSFNHPLTRPSADAEGHSLPPASAPAELRRGKQGGREGAELVDWAEVRRAYELTEESVAAIRTRFGLTKYRLQKKARDEGWSMRPRIAVPLSLPKARTVAKS